MHGNAPLLGFWGLAMKLGSVRGWLGATTTVVCVGSALTLELFARRLRIDVSNWGCGSALGLSMFSISCSNSSDDATAVSDCFLPR